MTSSGGLLYVGTGGGVLLALNFSTMELHFVFHAYTGAVRSLLLVSPEQQTKAFTRLLSNVGNHNSKTSFIQHEETSHSLNVPKRLHLDLKPMEPLPEEQSVLLSFGLGYRGVVGDSDNCPQQFILPSTGKKIATKSARPVANDGHLLLWSTEHHSKHMSSTRLESPQVLNTPTQLM